MGFLNIFRPHPAMFRRDQIAEICDVNNSSGYGQYG